MVAHVHDEFEHDRFFPEDNEGHLVAHVKVSSLHEKLRMADSAWPVDHVQHSSLRIRFYQLYISYVTSPFLLPFEGPKDLASNSTKRNEWRQWRYQNQIMSE